MEAASEARERPEEARRLYQEKREDAAETETMFNGAIQDALEKAEARETRQDRDQERGRSLWRSQTLTSSRRSSTTKKKHKNT